MTRTPAVWWPRPADCTFQTWNLHMQVALLHLIDLHVRLALLLQLTAGKLRAGWELPSSCRSCPPLPGFGQHNQQLP
jgi:hypothetical protein